MKLNDQPPPPPPAPPAPAPKKVNAAVLLITAAVFITLPLLAFAALYLWLNQTWFAAVDEVEPGKLATVEARLINLIRGKQNRPEPPVLPPVPPEDNTPEHREEDVDSTRLIKPDFDAFLAPLRGATPIEHGEWPAQAVFIGEIRVRDTDGRPGTVRLYRAPDPLPKGQPYPTDPATDPRVQRVYLRIGPHWYRAGELKGFWEVAQACAQRGTKVK